jgi:antitoxin component YwqK of YwqJK toxin-antitoxin module
VIYGKNGKKKFGVDLVGGLKCGAGKWWNKDGSLRFEGSFAGGGVNSLSGIQLYYNEAEKPIFEGRICNGVIVGSGKIFYLTAKRLFYSGNFLDGRPWGVDQGACNLYGEEKYLRVVGTLTQGDWKLTGRCKEYWPESRVLRYNGNFSRGKKNHRNAVLYDIFEDMDFFGDILDNLPQGPCKTYYNKWKNSGIFQEAIFKDGQIDDPQAKQYSETGELYFLGSMVNNLMEGRGKIFHKTGFVMVDSEFHLNQKSGDTILYNQNGYKTFHGEMKCNKRNGRGRIYHDNGIFCCSLIFEKDSYVGDRICFTGELGKIEFKGDGYVSTAMSYRSNLGYWIRDARKRAGFLNNFKFPVEYYHNGQYRRIGDKWFTADGKIDWTRKFVE